MNAEETDGNDRAAELYPSGSVWARGRLLARAAPLVEPKIPPSPTVPRAYFITFTTYGQWLHGDAAGSVDRQNNVFGTLVVKPNPLRENLERERLEQPPYEMDAARRDLVLAAIREVCTYRVWWLFAVHVRVTHAHVVVQAGDAPEKVMNDFKIYATRALNSNGMDPKNRRRWARHGSTRYLWNQKDLEGAIHYVLYDQGEPMSWFDASRVGC